jgi:hypothetical protein
MKRELGKSKKADRVDADEILQEYDFSRAGPNKLASRYAAGSMVVLEPDVAAAFPGAGEANPEEPAPPDGVSPECLTGASRPVE